jgi:hypothetical protein
MSIVLTLIVCGWGTTFVMVGFCALNESGMLLRIHRRLGLWLETLAPRKKSTLVPQRLKVVP